jgi:hypothetical protein
MSPRLDSRWGGSFPLPGRESHPLEAPGLAWRTENYAQIIEEKDPRTGKKKRKQVWPRYHQVGVVRQALAEFGLEGILTFHNVHRLTCSRVQLQ